MSGREDLSVLKQENSGFSLYPLEELMTFMHIVGDTWEPVCCQKKLALFFQYTHFKIFFWHFSGEQNLREQGRDDQAAMDNPFKVEEVPKF